MFLYDDKGKMLKSFTVRKSVAVLDIVVKRSGILVVCTDDRMLRLITSRGKVRTIMDVSPFKPTGLCLTAEEKIVVCLGEQRTNNHVAMFSAKGKTRIRKITVRDSAGRGQMSDPTRVVMNGEDITLLNWNYSVITFDLDGRLKWVYDGYQHRRLYGGIFNPRGLCIDKNGNLLISDTDGCCIHYVDRDGHLLRMLLTEKEHGIKYPCELGLDDETGKLWIGTEVWKQHVDCKT